MDAIRDASIGSCLAVPEFQFKKKRVQFLRLLLSGSPGISGVSTDQTRQVADAVLKQQDEKNTLAALETFAKDDKGFLSRIKGFFRSSSAEEGWQSASKRASSISNSEFLSDLRSIPIDHYLHEAAIDAEGTAYTLLTKQVDALVSRVNAQILSRQRKECDKQVQLKVDIEVAQEIQALWSNFVRQVKDVSSQHATSYVPVMSGL